MRVIGVVTTARSDYGIYLPVLKQIQQEPELELALIVSGMHLSPEFGLTVQQIVNDGFEIRHQVNMLLSGDSPEAIGKSIGLGIISFAQLFSHWRPDILLVLGDRFEMLCPAVASLPFKIPVAHIHGGESTEGAIDEAVRHSITKMSHLHFASTEFYAQRLKRMGEEPWRVVVSGAPSLDNLTEIPLYTKADLHSLLGVDFDKTTLLVTYHPVTLQYEETKYQIQELLASLMEIETQVLFTYPNADPAREIIIEHIQQFINQKPDAAKLVANLGQRAYYSAMKYASAMVGNSSSGIIEAASFQLPVVNIGERQRGRVRGLNVIDCGYSRREIIEAIKKVLSLEFRKSLQGLINPYGQGKASKIIIEKLKQVSLNDRLIIKRFSDL